MKIAKLHEVPIKEWIKHNELFKFVGDNIDVSMGVRDIRSDHLKHLCHMFSLLVVKSRIPPLQQSACTSLQSLRHVK